MTMKKALTILLVFLCAGLSSAQDNGLFCVTVGTNYLMGALENSNTMGYEIGVASKIPIADAGLVKTLLTQVSYIKLPWSDDIVEPERSDIVITTLVGAMAGNPTGLNVFGGPTVNFGMFDQGYLGLELGAGWAMEVAGINRIVDFSARYSVFNGINKIKDWDDVDALDLFRFNVTLGL